jgi:8-oxo-dGTP pyrophosphatase MutT (NUDIX family)
MRKFLIREVARVVVLDQIGNVLLVRYQDDEPLDPERDGPLSYWVLPGGALKPGESYRSAAQRELEEESRLLSEIGPEIWEVEHLLRSKDSLSISESGISSDVLMLSAQRLPTVHLRRYSSIGGGRSQSFKSQAKNTSRAGS